MAIVTAPLLALLIATTSAAAPTQVAASIQTAYGHNAASARQRQVPKAAAKPVAPVAPAVPVVSASALPATASGFVRARNNEPIAGALVQQEGSVTSAFTQPDGSFRLLLDAAGASTLVVSAIGYENKVLNIGNGRDLLVRLGTIEGFMPAAPLAPLAPIGLSAAETAPLNSGLVFQYAMRNNAVSAPGANGATASYGGWSNNDFRLGLRARAKPFLVEAEGAHFETPVDLLGLRKEDNPAFKPSTWQAGARVGLIAAVHSDFELAVMGAYRWTNTVPNNNRVPYTGSDIDFEQTRHAFGGYGLAAWRPWRGRWHLELAGGYYPSVYAIADSPGQPFGQTSFLEGRATLGYEILPGLRLGLGYSLERWNGTGEDQATKVLLGMHYTPGGVPKGNE